MHKNQELPSYIDYRNAVLTLEDLWPLDTVPFYSSGILKELPTFEKQGKPWCIETNPMIYSKFENWPKITVVSPSYNQGQYFESTIRSVLLQNYPNLEYIVMDGGSTDQSKSIIEKYAPWISLWRSEKDRGQSHAINKGFSLASGDILCWLNSDDYYLSETLFKVASAMIKHKAEFVYGNGYNLEADLLIPKITGISFDRYLRIPMFNQPACFWRKEIHQPIWEELHCSLDYELWVRIVKNAKKKYINEFLSVTTVHSGAKTHDSSDKAKAKWQEDHEKEVAVHGEVSNWNQLVFENYYLQKLLKMFPFFKNLF